MTPMIAHLISLGAVALTTHLEGAAFGRSMTDPPAFTRLEPDAVFGGPSILRTWSILGPSATHHQLTLNVVLRTANAARANLEEAFWAVSDPSHKLYGQHWTRDEVTAAIGNVHVCNAIADWLTTNGATEVRTSAHLDAVTADLNVEAASRLLNATFFDYQHTTRGTVLSRVGAAGYSVPAALAPAVLLIEGVGRLPELAATSPKSSRSPYAALNEGEDDDNDDAQSEHWPRSCGSGHLLCSLSPGVLSAAYSLPPPPRNTTEVHGSSFGVAEFQGERYDQHDLDHFSKTCNIQPPVKVDRIVGVGATSAHCAIPMVGSSDCGEALLDIQYAKALIGAIPLTNVFAKEYDILKWAQTVSALNDTELPLVQSVSYGMDESQQTSQQSVAYMRAANEAFMKLGVRGVSVLVASGDSGVCGNTGCDTYDPGANFTYAPVFPASSPYVTTVGATNFLRKSRIGEEEAWDNSGGGFSNIFSIPSYQEKAIAGYKLVANATLPNAAWWNASGRGYPDVSAVGGDKNSYCISGGGFFSGTWGTSASCPVVAAVFARLNSVRLSRGGRPLGFLNPWIYANSDAFNDVTHGVNDHEHKRDGGFAAAKGWDPATGVGTPNFPRMLAAL